MRKYKASHKVSLDLLLCAGVLAGAAMAQKQDKDTVTPPDATAPMPSTPQNRSGLPPAPPEVVPPGSAARPFTGNDATQPPSQTTVVPKKPPTNVPK
jgi:hypothetical protein